MLPASNKFDLDKALNEFKVNGILLIKGYMKNTVELRDLRRKIHKLVSLKAKKHNLDIPESSDNSLSNTIIKLNSINNRIGAYLNDVLNCSPELYQLLSSKHIINLAKKILQIKNETTVSNNFRLRVQIPGRDEISNLPWHQDSHYNDLYIKNNSVAIWTSISDIDYETGPVVFKLGSHVQGQLPKVFYTKTNGNKVPTIEERYFNDNRFKEYSIPTKSGDITLIDMNIIHRSGNNSSINKVKFSAQGRYHNAGIENFLAQYN